MRTVSLSILAIFLMISVAGAAGPDCEDWDWDHHDFDFEHDLNNYHYGWNDDINLKIDDGNVIITCDRWRYKSDEVKITEDYRLYVNGSRVEIDNDQKALVKKYYHKAIALNEEAQQIGLEGARIGMEGAKIGARAAKGVIQMLLLDFDEDKFEEEIEWEAEKLEEKAEELEERAEVLEDMAEELEETHEELEREIPELDELRWF